MAWLVLGLFLLPGVRLPAAAPSVFWNEFIIDRWENDDGLPENSATAMVQTPDGYLWFGTFKGLVRFDGARFTVFDPSNTPELPSEGIVNLHLDRAGRLWVSTFQGLARMEADRWRTFGVAEGWTANYVRTFAEGPRGELFITSFDGHVFRLEGDRWVRLPDPPGERQGYFGVVDRQGVFWAVQTGFFGHWDGQSWVSANQTGSMVQGLRSAHLARNGDLLLLQTNALVRARDGRLVSRVELKESLPPVWSAYEDRNGDEWVATREHGLYRILRDGTTTQLTTAGGLSYNSLRFCFEDREQNLWVGSSGGGLMRFKRRTFLSYGMESGLRERVVKSVAEWEPGRIVAGTYGGGLMQLTTAGAVGVGGPGDRQQFYVQSVLRDRRSALWVGTYKQGLFRWNEPAQWIPTEQSGGESVTALFEDSQGRVWIGGSEGVSRFDGVGFARPGGEAEFSPAAVGCFAEDRKTGTVLAGNLTGLFRFEGGRWTEILGASSNHLGWVGALLGEPDGTFWLGTTTAGLLRYRGGRFDAITEKQGLPTRSFGCILDDGIGHYWLASNRGIIRARKDDLHAVADGQAERLFLQHYTTSDGLPSVECPTGFQPTAMRDRQGRLWFATMKGVALVDPARVVVETNPPPVVIESVRAVDRHGSRQTLRLPGSVTVEVPAGSTQFRVDYTAPSFTSPEKIRFRHRLLSRGRVLDVVETGSRSASATLLPPGHYAFDVTAANHDGVWNPKGAKLAFTILPYFWQTHLFRWTVLLSVVGGACGTAWKLVQIRLRRERDRTEHERALAHEKGRLASVLEGTSDFVAFSALDGTVFYINPAGRRLIGLTETEELSRLYLRDLHPAGAAEQTMRTALETAARDGAWRGETVLRRRDGRDLQVSQVIVAHHDARGRPDFYSTILRDITELKESQQVLAELNEQMRLASFAARMGFWRLEFRTREIRTLQGDGPLTGLPPEARPQSLAQFEAILHPEDRSRVLEQARRTAETGEDYRAEFRICPPGQPVRWVSSFGHVVRDEAGQPASLLGFELDITDRIQLEDNFRQAQKLEAIGRLAGGVAHDFNNLLTVIRGNLDLVGVGGNLSPEAADCLHEAQMASERAAHLTRQLLAFSRRQMLQFAPLDLNQVVENLVRMLHRLIGEDVALRLDLAPGLPTVLADVASLDQVLMNLAVNARDAMPRGGTLSISTRETVLHEADCQAKPDRRAGSFVEMILADTGCGMSPETLGHIFEPFFTTKEVGKGTGLGLATVHGIIRQHQGWIEVDSGPGRGTTFHLLLPATSTPVPETASLPASAQPLGTETVLVAEDEAPVRRLITSVLQRQGYQVIEASTGPEALELVRRQPHSISLLVTDMVMPGGMTGGELAAAARPLQQGLRVLYISGYSREMVEGRTQPRVPGQFLPKPFRPDELVGAVRACLDGTDHFRRRT